MVSASACVGLTLPGMIDEPGSFSGMRSSANPARGPQAYQRTSFATFMSAPARVRSAALTFTIASPIWTLATIFIGHAFAAALLVFAFAAAMRIGSDVASGFSRTSVTEREASAERR